MCLQACLNGARAPDFHPALPLTPEAVARDAACVAAGAVSLHLHLRDAALRTAISRARRR
ncbi:3-keto-5-aminohexanoate cleavage protein [Roseomonas sp. GCM10028921]